MSVRSRRIRYTGMMMLNMLVLRKFRKFLLVMVGMGLEVVGGSFVGVIFFGFFVFVRIVLGRLSRVIL